MLRIASYLLLILILTTSSITTIGQQNQNDTRKEWWRDARYGMFIHWGAYSVSAGEWNGQSHYSEWLMTEAKIPLSEYRRQLVERFNPTKFDAAAWVKLAKDAGMKYIVITSKHHDGFVMFKSQVDDYNIVDATPFKRDPIRELAEECRKQGMRFGIYYSHILDWARPEAKNPGSQEFDRYWNNTVVPHLKELLTNYGDICEIWFDIGKQTPEDKVKEILAIIANLQPATLINNRVKSFSDYGDFISMGDNEIPQSNFNKDFESPMTLNHHWGYNKVDKNWKSAQEVIDRLIDIASKGGNLLLNVGPTGEGVIPEESAQVLREAGEWLARNGNAIYGTRPLPFPYHFDWGAMTTKDNKIYLLIKNWQGKLVLNGIKSRVLKAYPLNAPNTTLKFKHKDSINLMLPDKAKDKLVSVIVLELNGQPEVDQKIIQQGSGKVILNLEVADLKLNKEKPIENTAEWKFRIFTPGTYEVSLTNLHKVKTKRDFQHNIIITVNEQKFSVLPKTSDEFNESRSTQYPYEEATVHLGTLNFPRPGEYTLKLINDQVMQPSQIRKVPWQQDRLKIRTITLTPVKE